MITYRLRILIFSSLLAIIASSCQPGPATPYTALPGPTNSPIFTQGPLSTAAATPLQETPMMNQVPLPTPLDASVQQMVTQAREDLAVQLSIDPARVELIDVSSVTWPDSSLGCPRPGMAYTQVTVDGILIRFQVAGQSYEYHGGGGRAPFLCTNK